MLALININLNKIKNLKWIVKIIDFKNWICVGIAYFNKIKEQKFRLFVEDN